MRFISYKKRIRIPIIIYGHASVFVYSYRKSSVFRRVEPRFTLIRNPIGIRIGNRWYGIRALPGNMKRGRPPGLTGVAASLEVNGYVAVDLGEYFGGTVSPPTDFLDRKSSSGTEVESRPPGARTVSWNAAMAAVAILVAVGAVTTGLGLGGRPPSSGLGS